MKTVASRFGKFVLASAIVAISIGASHAQDVRLNPFSPTSTAEEREIIAQKERMRQSIREMMPEIKSMLDPVFAEHKTTLIEELATGGVSLSGGVDPETGMPVNNSAGISSGLTATGEPTLPGTNIPISARFVACFNGKAMYRDSNGVKYFNENSSDACPN